MINYDTYKSMTTTQKEEYNYKYKNMYNVFSDIKSLALIGIIFTLISVVSVFMTYLLMQQFPVVEHIESDMAINLLTSSLKLMKVWFYLVVIYIVYAIVFYLYKRHKLKKFLKTNNIKIVNSKILSKIYNIK